jgi:hypothetical protein
MEETKGKEEVKKRRARKKSAPLNRNGKRPGASTALKEKWADPVWAAKQKNKHRLAMYKRRGLPGRVGVPDGMRRAEAEKLWARAQNSAKRTIEAMAKNGVFINDDSAAVEALEFNITTMRGKHDIRSRLAAAAKVLEYTKSKPVAKSEVTLSKAEDWLAQVAASNDEANDQPETAPDEEASS